MNEFAGYEGTESNDVLLDTLVPKIGVQARAVIDGIAHGRPDRVVIVVVFQPEPDCRPARLEDVIAMMVRRGETGIAEMLRSERLGPHEHWLAIQRYEDGGGVIVMAKLKVGEVDVASLLN